MQIGSVVVACMTTYLFGGVHERKTSSVAGNAMTAAGGSATCLSACRSTLCKVHLMMLHLEPMPAGVGSGTVRKEVIASERQTCLQSTAKALTSTQPSTQLVLFGRRRRRPCLSSELMSARAAKRPSSVLSERQWAAVNEASRLRSPKCHTTRMSCIELPTRSFIRAW